VIAITAPEDDKLPGMMAYTMRYQEELRDAAEYFRDIKRVAVNEDSLELAETLIKKKAAKFDPAKFVDGYEAALKELVEAKVKHAPIPKDETSAPKRGNVINLMDALRKSVSGGEAGGSRVGEKKPPAKSGRGLSLIKSSTKSTAASGRKRKSA
jgi:DNA end-binding protein Ku